MARMARVVVPHNPPCHSARQPSHESIFHDADYEEYIDLMAQACNRANTEVWAYCLKPNHYFVMVFKTEDGLRVALGEAHRRYTRYINFRENWRGCLWQERFHSFPMDECRSAFAK